MISKDLATTLLGGAIAAGTAAQPVLSAVDGSFNQTDWIKMATAVFFAIFGFFTNKGSTSDKKVE